MNPQELAFIDADRPPAGPVSDPRAALKLVLRSREVLLITASYFFSNYVFYFFFNWLYIYLVQVRRFEELQGGALAAAPWIAGAFAATLGGRLPRYVGRCTFWFSALEAAATLSGATDATKGRRVGDRLFALGGPSAPAASFKVGGGHH